MFAVVLLSWSVAVAQETGASPAKIHIHSDFEAAATPAPWRGYKGIPVKVMSGDGACGTGGFLRVGPTTARTIGVSCRRSIIASEDTWIGFALRKPNGGRFKIMLADGRRKKNVAQKYGFSRDGSWRVYCLPLKWIGIQSGTKVHRFGFYLQTRNDAGASVYFDVDNIVAGTGRDFGPAGPLRNLRGHLKQDTVWLSWEPSFSGAGIAKFRVYRGCSPVFSRDERHLYAETTNAGFQDSAFAHLGDYFYAVRVVDLAGREGKDSGVVRVTVR